MNEFTPYIPRYSPIDFSGRTLALGQTIVASMLKSLNPNSKIGASIEITDRCNAGCSYCYVYPKDWNQEQRLLGYAQSQNRDSNKHFQRISKIFESLRQQGIFHVTLVGGEPALEPQLIKKAASLFPIVWVVTNGSISLPKLPNNTIVFVSIDGPPDYHNKIRDPQGFFEKFKYRELTGISGKIIKNINESDKGAFVHCTFTPAGLDQFQETIDWLVNDIEKLRGIVVSGVTVKSLSDPNAFTDEDRVRMKKMIEFSASLYGWNLFPFNTPKVNKFLFNPEYKIKDSSQCAVSQRIKSLDFHGHSTGKCVLRDESICETCICNSNGLMRSLEAFDVDTMLQQFLSLLG